MDYTNYAYKEAVGRLKLMLADSYSSPKRGTVRSNAANISADNYSSKIAVGKGLKVEIFETFNRNMF